MRRVLTVLLLAGLLGMAGGCGAPREAVGGYQLYFLADTESGHGPALDTEPYADAGQWADSEEPAEPTPEELVLALLEGPKTEGLRSPFPKGLSFQGWRWSDEEPGLLQVGFSEQYGGLTDISLTLADYCVVLTLSQLEGVESVEIISEGHMANYRSHPLLRPEEAVLVDSEADGSQT